MHHDKRRNEIRARKKKKKKKKKEKQEEKRREKTEMLRKVGRKAQAPSNWKILLVYLRFYKNAITVIATIKDNEVQERPCKGEEAAKRELNKGK